MKGMVRFTDRERRSFARNGFLTREDVLPAALVDDARRAVVDAIDTGPDDPEQVVGNGYNVAAEGVDEAPLDEIVDALVPVVDALVGEGTIEHPGGGMQVALNFPDADTTDEVHGPKSVTGHLDGYANFDENPNVHAFSVGATVYLDDVPPRTGGFTVWPGTHRVAAKYFEDHALETIGGKPNNAELPAMGDEPGEWDYSRRYHDQADPYEVSGDAGTVVLWHSRLLHCAGINTGERIRMAAIKRFQREGEDDTVRDAAPNLFKYWPAMEGVPLVAGGDPVASKRDWL
jgi:hypothetical protein